MLSALVLAAALPLGVWPIDAGPAVAVVDDVEVYLVEPEDDYYILAVQQLAAPMASADEAALKRLAVLAQRLGADAVLLLGGMAESEIPEDLDDPLPPGDRLTMAVFIGFDTAADDAPGPTLTAVGRRAHARRRFMASPPPPSARKITACTAVRY